MKFFAAVVLLIGAASLNAQTPEVPDQIQFAGITLTIRDDAKKEIQKDVNLLTQHAGYFSVKTDRAKLFFPIIEKIFEEDGVPPDFKFLALQESSLVADAVSSSNAVGFWQFKDYTAMEMGLRVDEMIDERMHVVAATKGAANYLKKNNLQFNNWIYTLQSYQMGAGGVKKAVADLQNGATAMDVTADTYWYVKRFLAHKIAFENGLTGEPEMKLITYQASAQKDLKDIAQELSVEIATLKEYNKWLKADLIPDDKEYTVIVPVGKLNSDFNKLFLPAKKISMSETKPKEMKPDSVFQINGIGAILSRKSETINQLAVRCGLSLDEFVEYNEIEYSFIVQQGMVFFKEKKKNKAEADFHKAKAGEDLWRISQLYGIRFKKLKKFNPEINGVIKVGEVVWLGSKRPEVQELALEEGSEVAKLNNAEPFEWETKSPAKAQTDSLSLPHLQKVHVIDSTATLPMADYVNPKSSHTISAGETLYSVSNQYKIKVTDLLKWNNLSIHDKLKPGQILVLADTTSLITDSKNISTTQSVTFHEVKSSDTLYSIARQYGVTIRDIMEWNYKKDFTLTSGERLQIHIK
jgi:membrane-bound lytic murein transglycosylase D